MTQKKQTKRKANTPKKNKPPSTSSNTTSRSSNTPTKSSRQRKKNRERTSNETAEDTAGSDDIHTILETNGDGADESQITVDVNDTLREREQGVDDCVPRSYCTSRCKSCQSCQCVQAKHICVHEGDDDKICKCDPATCKNKTEKESDDQKFGHYSEKNFTSVDTTFESTDCGPDHDTFSDEDTPFQIFTKLLGSEVKNHVIEQTHLYFNFNQTFANEQKALKKYYVDLKKWNLLQRAAKSNANVSTISSDNAKGKKKRHSKKDTSSEDTYNVSKAKKRFANPTLTQITKFVGTDQQTVTVSQATIDNSQSSVQSGESNSQNHEDSQNARQTTLSGQPKPVKPVIPNFHDWKQGKTPEGKGPFHGDAFDRYIQVLCAMGMNVVQGGYYTYWSKDKLFNNLVISKIMSRDEFVKCTKYMMYDEEWFEDKLNERWTALFIPSQRISIDETLIRLLQSFSFQQFNPSKPAKRGLKYLAMACATTGYLLRSKLYKGSKSGFPTTPQGIVISFIDWLAARSNKRYIYAFDNWFTTYDLALELAEKKIPFVGTVRANRPSWLWSGLKKYIHTHGDWTFTVSEDGNHVALSHWHNSTKPVNFLTNLGSKDVQMGSNENKTALPKVSYEYKIGMSGVDQNDKIVSNAQFFPYKTYGYLKRNFFTKMAQNLANAKIIYNLLHPKTKDSSSVETGFHKFKKQFVYENFSAERMSGHFCNSHLHFSSKIQTTTKSVPAFGKDGSIIGQECRTVRVRSSYQWFKHEWSYFDPTPMCQHCLDNSVRSRTSYTCKACGVALHPACMLEYHYRKHLFAGS